MITDFFHFNEELLPPSYKATLGNILGNIQNSLLGFLNESQKEKKAVYANDIFLKTPAIITSVLNYRIKTDNEPDREALQNTFLGSINLSKSLFSGENCIDELVRFRDSLDPELSGHIYLSEIDKYTWKATNPSLVFELSKKINKDISHVIGIAHGSIPSSVLLSNYLDAGLYLIRFSRFKRKDRAPVILKEDSDYLRSASSKTALLLDEDVAQGTTLKKSFQAISPYFDTLYTAAVTRHYLSRFSPDFAGKVWYD